MAKSSISSGSDYQVYFGVKPLSSGAEQGRGETDRQRLKRETVDWIVGGGPEGTGLDA